MLYKFTAVNQPPSAADATAALPHLGNPAGLAALVYRGKPGAASAFFHSN